MLQPLIWLSLALVFLISDSIWWHLLPYQNVESRKVTRKKEPLLTRGLGSVTHEGNNGPVPVPRNVVLLIVKIIVTAARAFCRAELSKDAKFISFQMLGKLFLLMTGYSLCWANIWCRDHQTLFWPPLLLAETRLSSLAFPSVMAPCLVVSECFPLHFFILSSVIIWSTQEPLQRVRRSFRESFRKKSK